METVKVDISKLNDLRKEVGLLLVETQKMWSADRRARVDVAFSTPVVIVFYDNHLMACYRSKKIEGSIEVVRVSEMDAVEGPLSKRFDKYISKVARFLEKRGLYQPRGAITDKTPSLFEEKGETQ